MTHKEKVLAVYPDAVPCANDYYAHWIGRPALSDGFEEDRDKLSIALNLPFETEEEMEIHRAAVVAVEQEALDKAWADAASRLPEPPKWSTKPHCCLG